MSFDITHCTGGDCPLKEKCHRYKPGIKEYKGKYTEYFTTPPFKIKKGKFKCDMFWGEQSEFILEVLKDIVRGRDN